MRGTLPDVPLPRSAVEKVAISLLCLCSLRCWPISPSNLDGLSDGEAGQGASGSAGSIARGGSAGTDAGTSGQGGDSGTGGTEATGGGSAGRGGCTTEIPPTDFKRVFVSSEVSNAAFKSLNGAHKRCQDTANRECLGGTWKAWISDSSNSPSTYFVRSAVPYRLLDGVAIATNWDDLVDGQLNRAINVTEKKQRLGSQSLVWTGTTATGTSREANCINWTSESGLPQLATAGLTNAINADWTGNSQEPCNRIDLRLYCFEQ